MSQSVQHPGAVGRPVVDRPVVGPVVGLRRLLAAPVRAEAGGLVASGVLSVLRTGVELARPWPLALAVDHALTPATSAGGGVGGAATGPWAGLAELSPVTVLVAAGAAGVLLSWGSGLIGMLASTAAERGAERVGVRLRAEAFAAAQHAPLRWHDRIRSGELLARLTSDVGRLLDAVVAVTAILVPDLVAVLGVLVLLLVIDPWLAALGLLAVPVLALLSVRQRRMVRRTQGDARAVFGRFTATTSDLVRNVLAVQAFNRHDRAQRDFDHRSREVCAVEVRAVQTEARWTPRSDLVLALGAALVLVAGGLQVRSGAQTTGHLLVVLAYLTQLYAPVRGLTRLASVLAKASASADRVGEILTAGRPPVRTGAPLPAPTGVTEVRFDDVWFGYRPDRPVLSGFDLTLHAGEIVCLFGPSGIGKSTVLLLLLRLYDADQGSISLNGEPLDRYDVSDLRDTMAYVPQDPWLLDATLAQNVAFGSRSATRADVERACRAARVDEFVDRLPLGYDTPLGEGARRLSGGQRRRVALARAAVSSAPILLLDEPTASLDAVSAYAVIDAIRAAAVGRTTVLVTHDPQLAAIADRVVVLDHVGVAAPVPTSTERR